MECTIWGEDRCARSGTRPRDVRLANGDLVRADGRSTIAIPHPYRTESGRDR
jgi:hypothetical protein